jgi:hypothetical protein
MLGTVAVFGPLVVALWVFSVADVLATPRGHARRLSKRRWLVLTSFLPLAGFVAWVVAGRPSTRSRRRSTWHGQTITDSDIRELITASAPHETEDFRRRCRERAQEQRSRYAAQQQTAREANGANGAAGPAE